jgi:arylsulfatase A-like enzyme
MPSHDPAAGHVHAGSLTTHCPSSFANSLNGGTGRRWLQDPALYQKWIRTDYRLITRADMAVGQVMDALRQSGLDQNTVVIFTSDNGELQGRTWPDRQVVDVRRVDPRAADHSRSAAAAAFAWPATRSDGV